MRIAISGKRCSGKTTFANELENFGFQRIAFADALKQELVEMGKATEGGLSLDKENVRDLMQSWGQRRRDEDKAYWIKQLLYHIGTFEEYNMDPNFVVDDLRYLNEAVALRANGFVLIRLNCPYEIREIRAELKGSPFQKTPGGLDLADKHQSECELDSFNSFDEYIDTDRLSIDGLRKYARRVLADCLLHTSM